MIFLKPKHYTGLDHSGPNRVCPPTFQGVKALVEKVGYAAAALSFEQPDLDKEDESHDLVREFLEEISFADKVERQSLISEFSKYVSDLDSQFKASSKPSSEAPSEAPSEASVSEKSSD